MQGGVEREPAAAEGVAQGGVGDYENDGDVGESGECDLAVEGFGAEEGGEADYGACEGGAEGGGKAAAPDGSGSVVG